MHLSTLEVLFSPPRPPSRPPPHLHTAASPMQTGIPDADAFGNPDVAGVAEVGWREQVFGRIRKVFGYGC